MEGPRVGCSTDAHYQWDRCLSSMLIRSGLGVSFGIVFSVLLFKRRAWPAWVGLGFGAGRAWEECDTVRQVSTTGSVCSGSSYPDFSRRHANGFYLVLQKSGSPGTRWATCVEAMRER